MVLCYENLKSPTFPLSFSVIVDSPLRTFGTPYITCIVICKLSCKSCVRLIKKISNFDYFALMVCITFDCHLLSTVKTLPYMLKHQQFTSYPEFTLHSS